MAMDGIRFFNSGDGKRLRQSREKTTDLLQVTNTHFKMKVTWKVTGLAD
jgi:hypothetical protein